MDTRRTPQKDVQGIEGTGASAHRERTRGHIREKETQERTRAIGIRLTNCSLATGGRGGRGALEAC